MNECSDMDGPQEHHGSSVMERKLVDDAGQGGFPGYSFGDRMTNIQPVQLLLKDSGVT